MQMMFYMCFCYGLETWMMKRAWRDQGSNLEKFSYLHSDLTGNDVLLVTFFDGSHPQNTANHFIFYIFAPVIFEYLSLRHLSTSSSMRLDNKFGCFAASLAPLDREWFTVFRTKCAISKWMWPPSSLAAALSVVGWNSPKGAHFPCNQSNIYSPLFVLFDTFLHPTSKQSEV